MQLLNTLLIIICFNLKKRSKFFLLLILLVVSKLTADQQHSSAVDLEYNTGYLTQNLKSDVLAYIMIHYNDLKLESSILEVNSESINELSYLVSKYKNISLSEAKFITFQYINSSKNPVSLFHMYTQ